MNKFIDWIIVSFIHIITKTKLYLIQSYNKIYFLINKNFTLSKMYKPIIKEKMNTNNKLHETLNHLEHKYKEAENVILKLENENKLLQAKISKVQDLITKRHD
ncbi:hypothetical protein [Clostridium sp.]|uniref:hypothetical protein n=1 Tax=Clostridium sp. TaxID=1506 RepID=UPI001A4B2AB5|nr:hypothetical protein [Clostridium sp.]MBK5236992.1 hypothetical protein [Clostridium sp.]